MMLARVLYRRIAISADDAGPLLNTIRLGRHLFNPHRFEAVLRSVVSEPTGGSIDITNDFNDYLAAGIKCFSSSTNLRLMKIGSIVDILKILKFDLNDSGSLYNAIVRSLAVSIDSERRLSELLLALRRTSLDEPILEETMRKGLELAKPLSRTRIKVAHLTVNPAEYLNEFLEMSLDKLVDSGLSESDLATILSVCGDSLAISIKSRFVSAIETLLRIKLEQGSPRVTDRLKVLNILLSIGSIYNLEASCMKLLLRVVEEDFADTTDVLSPSQTVDLLHLFPSATLSKVAWLNLLWRVKMDSAYLYSLDSTHCVRLLEALSRMDADIRITMQGLIHSIKKHSCFKRPADIVDLISASSKVGFLEYPELTDAVFAKIFAFGAASKVTSSSVVEKMLVPLVHSLGLTEEKLICTLIDKFNFETPSDKFNTSHTLFQLVRLNVKHSNARIGNLIVSKVLASDSKGFEKVLESVAQTGLIPLHSTLTVLSITQLIQLIESCEASSKHLLVNAEMISDAASLRKCEPVSELLDLFVELTKMRFPSRWLVETLCDRFSELSLSESVGFIQACAEVRFLPHPNVAVVNYEEALSAEAITNLTCSLSSLGLIRDDQTAGKLTNRFILSVKDSAKKERLASQFLAALFISLKVPSKSQLGELIRLISSSPSSAEDFERDVFSEMGRILDNRILSSFQRSLPVVQCDEWTRKLGRIDDEVCSTGVRVGETDLSLVDLIEAEGRTAVMIVRPGDCYLDNSFSQLFKFKVFLVSHTLPHIEVRYWNRL